MSSNDQVPKIDVPVATKQKRVAIVDDEKDIRNIVSLVLRKAGHNVIISATNGKEIVDYLANGNSSCELDMILMDYAMPVMNGLEASKIITSRKPGTRIIFVSAADVSREVKEAGFEFIPKPFSIRKLLDLVNE